MLLSCQSLSVSLAMPINLIRRGYWISLHGTMAILPDNVTVMTRYNGRIDGDTTNKYGGTKRAWTQHIIATSTLLNIYTINLSDSFYTTLAIIFLNACGLEMDCSRFHYLICIVFVWRIVSYIGCSSNYS